MKEIEYVPLVVADFQEGASNLKEDEECYTREVIGDSQCPCCGYITIPNKGDAHAYICPVCFWEIDFFINSEDEASDSNHGLTVREARENYKQFGAVKKELKEYCRAPKKEEKTICDL